MEKGTVVFERVSKKYGSVLAVNDVSFRIAKGTLVTLLGPSGCGKTTTLRMIAGLELATSGKITIGGKDVTRAPASERDVAMVFQSYALFPHLSVIDNVTYGLISRKMPRAEAETKGRDGLNLVGLSGMENRLPSELSGGQQQRVALARALVLSPEVLLFDEPLSNLDARLRRRMRQEIREIQQRLGFTAVYVTHDRDEALSISDRIIVMDKSVVVQEGAPRELYESPATRFVAEFMSEANVLQAVLQNDRVSVGSLQLQLPSRGLSSGPVQLAVRPEALTLAAAGSSSGLEGRIVAGAYLGSFWEYEVDTGAGKIRVVTRDPSAAWKQGDLVAIAVDQRGAVLLPP